MDQVVAPWSLEAGNGTTRRVLKHLENVKKVFGKDQPRALLNVPTSESQFAMHGVCWDTRLALVSRG